jgi:Na+-driven multidrug efflux pump
MQDNLYQDQDNLYNEVFLEDPSTPLLSNNVNHNPRSQEQSDKPSLAQELATVTGSVTPNDFFVSLGFFFATLCVTNLPEYEGSDDGATLAFITVVSHTCLRIIAQGYQIPAIFIHEGLHFNESTHKLEDIDEKEFTNSIAAMIKAGVFSGILAAAFLAITPLLYQLTGTPHQLVKDSYQYIMLASAALVFQNCNCGFQQTLLKLGKKGRMLQAATLNAILIDLPILALILFGNPSSIPSLSVLGAIFLIGNALLTLFYALYLKRLNAFPTLSTYFDKNNTERIKEFFESFRNNGFDIFLQLLSELGTLYIQPFIAKALLPEKYLTAILLQLVAAGNLNLFTIVPAITGSQATSNAVDTQKRHITGHQNGIEYYDNLRQIILSAFTGMTGFSTLLNIILMTAIAPIITNLFYNPDDINIPGPTSNPYFFIGLVGLGTTIDYLRNLSLFVLRPLNVNKYGTFSSVFCLWFVNLALAAGLCQIEDIGVFGVLAPYYTAILIGTIMLWTRLYECVKDNDTILALVDNYQNQHKVTVQSKERRLPECLSNLLERFGQFGGSCMSRNSENRTLSVGVALTDEANHNNLEALRDASDEASSHASCCRIC